MLIDSSFIIFSFTVCFLYCSQAVKVIINARETFWIFIGIAIPVYVVVMFLFGVYRSLWRYAQSKEFFVCIFSSVVSSLIFYFISRAVVDNQVPLYFYILFMLTSAMMLVAIRLLYRIYRDFMQGHKPSDAVVKEPLRRALIVGGGAACAMLINEIKINTAVTIKPVAIVDDDISKAGKSIGDVRIVGTCAEIEKVCEKYRVSVIVIALPSATNSQRAKILDECAKTRCAVKIIPRLYESNDKTGMLNRLRSITVEELLGRDPVEVADEDMLSFISGKRILVTGGGGSIGSELCRQIALYNPEELIIVDFFENNAYNIQQELIRKYGNTLKLTVLIASVREFDTIDEIIANTRPHIILHAAAHKHVPLMEASPCEAIKNNIFGTYNVATAAKKHNVEKFIMISTDKAVNPTNIMGATKRACEMVVQSMNDKDGQTQFASVRFGNVLGSSGSVIPLFKQQIAEGGPVTVTHPDIIRYFMTIPEASQLVLTAGAIARGGEIFVLDMGSPVKILDLAKKMIQLSGLRADEDIKIEFTGLRPGEKLYEELLMNEEGMTKTDKDKIFVGKQIEFNETEFYNKLEAMEAFVSVFHTDKEQEIRQAEQYLMDIVPTFSRAEART